MFSTVAGGPDIFQLPEHFVDYSQELDNMQSRALPLDGLWKFNGLDEQAREAILNALPQPPEQLVYLPVDANTRDGVAIIDKQSGAVLRLLALNPKWGD